MAAPPIPGILQVQRLTADGKIPTRGSQSAAGYDLYASAEMSIKKGSRAVVKTDIAIAVPPSTYGRIAPRSGLAVKHGIDTGAGVIDEDYRGPIGVVLFNHGDCDYEVQKGDRIAQLIIEQILTPPVREVSSLTQTLRGTGGFGSTGKSTIQKSSKEAAQDSSQDDSEEAEQKAKKSSKKPYKKMKIKHEVKQGAKQEDKD